MSLSFDGVDDNIAMSQTSLNNFTSFTYAIWMFPTTVALDENQAVSKAIGGTGKQLGVGALFGNSAAAWCYVTFSGIDSFVRTANGRITTQGWQFLAGTYASGNSLGNIYYGKNPNDIAESTSATQNPTGSLDADASSQFAFGARVATGGAVDIPFTGRLAFGHLYNRVLALNELKQLAAAPGSISRGLQVFNPMLTGLGSQPDYSGKGNTGTLTGALPYGLGPPIDGVGMISTPGMCY